LNKKFIVDKYRVPLAISAALIVSIVVAALVFIPSSEASPNNQAVPEIAFVETCISDLQLTLAPNGLAGFSIEVDVPVEGTTTSDIGIDTATFPLSSVAPVQKMLIRGVDLNGVVQAGAVDTTLFTISPCITSAIIRAMDDDNGDPIFPPGTVITP